MRIIKHGRIEREEITRTVTFECKNCGCIFEEDTMDLRPKYAYTCPCPDCGREVWSNKYKDTKYINYYKVGDAK